MKRLIIMNNFVSSQFRKTTHVTDEEMFAVAKKIRRYLKLDGKTHLAK